MSNCSYKILVTGFRPFQGEKINPSEVLLEWIKRDFPADVQTLLLPVSFREAPALLENELLKYSYNVVLMLGQAGGRTSVCLERVALNWIETSYPDEEGVLPTAGRIESQGEAAFFSELPLEAWKKKLEALNLPVTISLNAGGYVCNALYYSASRSLVQKGRPLHLCFIHVPYLPEQVMNKASTVAMEFDKMQEVLRKIIGWCLEK